MSGATTTARPPLSRAGRSAPVWVRLVALALVPTIGMAVLTAREAVSSAADARHAVQTAETTTEITHLLNLLFTLTSEQINMQAITGSMSYGVPVELASEMIGYDLAEQAADLASEVDTALASVPPELFAALPDLEVLRRDLPGIRLPDPAPARGDATVDESYERLTALVQRAADDRTAALIDGTTALPDREVAATIDSLSMLISTFSSVSNQLAMGGEVFGPDTPVSLSLVFAVGDFRRASDELLRARDPQVRARWREIVARPELVRLDAGTDELLADSGWLLAGGTERMAEMFADTFLRVDLLAELSRQTVTSALDAAGAAEADARYAFWRSIAGSVTMTVAVLVGAFVVSRSISRPLQLLARRADMVNDGELAMAVSSGKGPREVRTVAQALDAAASSLRRIEEQALALADGRLDDPVLSAAVPGVLGESVHASVAQLSRSLRDQDELRQRLDIQAHHDALTGLPNRAGFVLAAEHSVARCRRTGSNVALLFLDLDGFKLANDTHGHLFGDKVLQATAARLSQVARADDTVARLGGDEFVVIAESMADIDQALALGKRLIAAVAEPLVIDGHTTQVGASVGVSISDHADGSALEMLAEADQAVYRAKRSGRGRVEVYDDGLRQEVAARKETETALRLGIVDGELELHYQPVVSASTGRLHGFEALVRWDRPGHGLVPPMDFIPIAEASDLVIDLGRWVLLTATTQLAAWSDAPELADATVSVNISGRHLLDPGVVDDVARALERSGLAPHRLVVEITETVVLSDLGVAVLHLRALRALGVRIALDDFGTGYTSIGQLGLLPVDILKVDRSFVTGLDQESGRSIVGLMVGVAHTLGIGLVAEGVETTDQLDVLQDLDCDEIQGYLISRPLPATDAAAWAAAAAVPQRS